MHNKTPDERKEERIETRGGEGKRRKRKRRRGEEDKGKRGEKQDI